MTVDERKARMSVRITKVLNKPERDLKDSCNRDTLGLWLTLSKADLEFRLRYSKEETPVLQGALRVIDDLEGILKQS